jgi:hypothetical protein
MGRTRDVSKILTSNTSILSLASASSIYQTIAKTGLIEITPATISVTGGSGSISATGAVSFTSASAISLNDVFSGTYQNYRFLINLSGSSAQTSLRLRMRSGTDVSGANYNCYATGYTSGTSTRFLNDLGGTSVKIGEMSGKFSGSYELMSPFEAVETLGTGQHFGLNSTGNQNENNMNFSFKHGLSTSYPSFTIFPDSGTFTGTISVYGYNK